MLLHHQEHQDTRTQQVRHELKEQYNDKRLHPQEHHGGHSDTAGQTIYTIVKGTVEQLFIYYC